MFQLHVLETWSAEVWTSGAGLAGGWLLPTPVTMQAFGAGQSLFATELGVTLIFFASSSAHACAAATLPSRALELITLRMAVVITKTRRKPRKMSRRPLRNRERAEEAMAMAPMVPKRTRMAGSGQAEAEARVGCATSRSHSQALRLDLKSAPMAQCKPSSLPRSDLAGQRD